MDRRDELYVKVLEDALKLVGTFSTVQEAIELAAAHHSGEGLANSTRASLAKAMERRRTPQARRRDEHARGGV